MRSSLWVRRRSSPSTPRERATPTRVAFSRSLLAAVPSTVHCALPTLRPRSLLLARDRQPPHIGTNCSHQPCDEFVVVFVDAGGVDQGGIGGCVDCGEDRH